MNPEHMLQQHLSPAAVDMDPNLAFIYELYLNKGPSDKIQYSNIAEDENFFTDFEKFFENLDLSPEVEDELEEENKEKNIATINRLTRNQKLCVYEFFQKIHSFRQSLLERQFESDPFVIKNKTSFAPLNISDDLKCYFENIAGNNPRNWPVKLDEFVQALQLIPHMAFFYQPFKLYKSFYADYNKRLGELLLQLQKKKLPATSFPIIPTMMASELLVNFLRGSLFRTLSSLESIKKTTESFTPAQNKVMTQTLINTIAPVLRAFLEESGSSNFDFYPVIDQMNKIFALSDLKCYDMNVQDSYSVATDGSYLYEAICSPNLIHLTKVGTGTNGTEAGILYKEAFLPLANQKNVSLVYLKNKLLLKYNLENFGSIDVYSPDTLEKSHTIHLNIKEYMKNPHTLQYNKYFQIFTDGEFLYTTLLKYKFIKIEKEKKATQAKTKDAGSDKNKSAKDQEKPATKEKKEPEPASKKKDESEQSIKNKMMAEMLEKVNEVAKTLEAEKSYKLNDVLKDSTDKKEGEADKKSPIWTQEQLDQKFIESLIQEERLLMSQIQQTSNRNAPDNSEEFDRDILTSPMRDPFFFGSNAYITPENSDKGNRLRQADKEALLQEHLPLIDFQRQNIFDGSQGLRSNAFENSREDENRQSSILFIKNFFRSNIQGGRAQDEPESNDSTLQGLHKYDKISFFKHLEQEKISEEELIPEFLKYSRENFSRGRGGLYRGGRGRIVGSWNNPNNTNTTKPGPSTTQPAVVEGEKHLLEFFVVKFDIDKQEESVDSVSTQNHLEDPLVVELFASFSSYFTLSQCSQAIKKNGRDIAAAADWLLRENQTTVSTQDVQPISSVLIYQTEVQNYDFKQTKVVKPFNAVPKSLLSTNDLLTGAWFVRNNLILRSNGALFSLDQKDEILAEPHELENIEALVKNKLARLDELIQNPSENIDWILKKIKSANGQALKLASLDSKEISSSSGSFKIRTTYLKSYSSNSFFGQSPTKKIFYDPYNSLFFSVLFDKLPNANYGFMRQKVQFYHDNLTEGRQLNKLTEQVIGKKLTSVDSLLTIVNAQDVDEFAESFIEFLTWINQNRTEMPKRLNDWICTLNAELKSITEKKKKSKTNLNAKIKKLVDLKKKSNASDKNALANFFNKDGKLEAIREIDFVHYLCVKGNLKTVKLLIKQLIDPSVKLTTKRNLMSILKIWTQYFHYSHSLNELVAFGDYVFDILKHNDFKELPELKTILIQLAWIFIPHKSSFMKFFIHAIFHDDDFLLQLTNNLFENELTQNNFAALNSRLLLSVSKELIVNEKTDKVLEYSPLTRMKKIIGKGFAEQFQLTEMFKELTNKLFIRNDEFWFKGMIKAIRSIAEICFSYSHHRKTKLLKVEKDAQAVNTQYDVFKETLALHLLDILNKIYKQRNLADLSQATHRELKQLESFVFVLLFKSKIKNIGDIETIVKALIQILSKNIDFFSKNYPQQMAAFKCETSKQTIKGISQLDTHIAETPHPIERGKNITFKRIFHEKAIGYLLEFDKRCQDDESTDSLIITSWFHPEKKGVTNIVADAHINRYLNICGKKTLKKTIVMIGNSLDIQFISSNMAKNNAKSLSQWGYKIFIRPIYGQTTFQTLKGSQGDIKVDRFIHQSLNIIDNLTICARMLIEILLKGSCLGQSEKHYEPFLGWYILHKGLTNLDISKFLVKSKSKDWVLRQRSSQRHEHNLIHHSNESERTSMVSKTNNDKLSLFNEELDIQEIVKLAQDKSSNVYNMVSHIKSLVTLPFAYQAEKRRMSFKLPLQKYWEEIDTIMIICFLHHSNIISLLKTNKNIDLSLLTSQVNIKEQLQAMAKKRNEVLTFMIQEVKIEQELQDNLNSIFDLLKAEYTIRYVAKRIQKFNEQRNKEEEVKKEEEIKNKKDLIKKKILSLQMTKKNKTKKPKTQKESSQNPSQADDQSTIKREDGSLDESSFHYFTTSEIDEILHDSALRISMKKILTDSFESKTEDLKKLFKRKELDYTKEPKENFEILLRHILHKIKDEVVKTANDEKIPMQINLESPYQQVGDLIMERVQFLLKINSELPETEETPQAPPAMLQLGRGDSIITGTNKKTTVPADDDEDLQPLGYARCLTSDNKIKPKDFNVNKSEEKNWVDVYKLWKLQMNYKQEDLKSSECSPIFAVNKFLTIDRPLKIQTLQSIMLKSSHRAALRIIGLQLYKSFLTAIHGTWAESESLCILSATFSNVSVFDNIQTTHSSLKTALAEISLNVSNLLMKRMSELTDTLKSVDVLEIYKFIRNLELDDMQMFENQLDRFNSFFRQTFLKQSEILTLINSHEFAQLIRPLNVSDPSAHKKLQAFIASYLKSVVELNLFLISSRNISFDLRDTSVLMKKCFKINNVIIRFTASIWKDNPIVVQLLTGLLQVELGERQSSSMFTANIFNRMSDSIGEDRLVYLLKNLRISLRSLTKSNFKSNEDSNYLWELLKDRLMIIILSSQNARIIKISLRCLEILNEGFQILRNILEEDIFKRINFQEVVCDRVSKNQFMTRFAPYTSKAQLANRKIQERTLVNSSAINEPLSNNLLNTLHKIGDLALPQFSPASKDTQRQSENHVLLMHMLNEEDLCPLIRVFYHWENLYPTFSKKFPKTMAEYLELTKKNGEPADKNDKKIKKIAKAEQAIQLFQQMTNKMRLKENIIQNIPDFNLMQGELPIGWYLNSSNQFKNFKISAPGRKLLVGKTTRKMWETKNFNKLIFTIIECLKMLKPPVFVNVDKKVQEEKEKQESIKTEDTFEDGYFITSLFESSEQTAVEQGQAPVPAQALAPNPVPAPMPSEEQNFKIAAENPESEDAKKTETKLPEKPSTKPAPPSKVRESKEAKSTNETKTNPSGNQTGRSYVNVSKEEQQKIEQEFLQTFRLLSTLLEICKYLQTMTSFFNFMGYSAVYWSNGIYEDKQEKIEELAYLINMLLHKKMSEVPTTCVTDENILKKLGPVMKFVNERSFNLDLSVSIAKFSVVSSINKFARYSCSLRVPHENYVKYVNKYAAIYQNAPLAKSKTFIIKLLSNFVKSNINTNQAIKDYVHDLYNKLFNSEIITKNERQDERIKLGLLILTTNWMSEFSIGDKVRFPLGDQEFKIVGLPETTGKKNILVINEKEPKGLVKLSDNSFTDNDHIPFDSTIIEPFKNSIISKIICLMNEPPRRKDSATSNTGLTYLANQDKAITNKMTLALLLKIYLANFHDADSAENQELKKRLEADYIETMGDFKELENNFVLSIERLIDSQQTQPIKVLEHYHTPESRYPFELERRKASIKIEELLNTRSKDFDSKNYISSKSTYISGMPMTHPRSSDYKMLKHWEKHIIPKILSFVKGSLSAYEIEDFFEQMRIELRKENHVAASNIAYILCDQKLPNDCTLPELNYDWACLDIDEVRIGQYVSIKIKDDRNLYSHIFEQYYKLGIYHVFGTVCFKDPANSSVNVLIRDLYQNNLISVWVPHQAVKPIEVPVAHPASSFPVDELLSVMHNSFSNFYKVIIREYFCKQFLCESKVINFESDFKTLKLLIQRELKGKCLGEWLVINGSMLTTNIKNKTLAKITDKLESQNLFHSLVDSLQADAKNIVTFFQANNYSFDMTTKLDSDIYTNEKVGIHADRNSRLNIFDKKEEIAGLVIEYKNNSNIYKCSGIKFFSDVEGINLIKHIQATQKSTVKNLYPLIFDFPDVYYQFYYNSEALPIYMKSQSTSKLDCTVFAIPYLWNYLLWSLDITSSYAIKLKDTKLLTKCYTITSQLFTEFKGPNTCRQFLLKIMSRLMIKIRVAFKKLTMTTEEKAEVFKALALSGKNLKSIISEFEFYLENTQDDLYSSLLQDLSEFLAIYLSVVSLKVPSIDPEISELLSDDEKEKLKSCLNLKHSTLSDIQSLFSLAEFIANPSNFQSEKGELKDLWSTLQDSLDPTQFFNNILIINNVPELSASVAKNIILEAIKKQKMKVLAPDLDIYIPTTSDDLTVGYAVILYDGWEFPDPSEVKSEEPIVEEEPAAEEEKQWECEICTLLNLDSSAVCIACESPKPVNPVYPLEIKKLEEAKAKKSEELEGIFSIKLKQKGFKDAVLQGFNRVSADKRIDIKYFKRNSMSEIESSNEIMEFFLFRITSELFQEKLKQTSQDIYNKFRADVQEVFGTETAEALYDHLVSLEPLELFERLADFGYDFWLEKSGLAKYQSDSLKLIAKKDMERFLEFVEHDICYESDFAIEHSGFDFRLEYKSPLTSINIYGTNPMDKLLYKESKLFYVKLVKMNNYSNFTLRLTITAIQRFNKLLKKYYKLLNISSSENQSSSDDQECLSLGSLISNLRDFWLSSVKNFICQEILNNTALVRDETPKVHIERLTKEREIMGDKRLDGSKRSKKESVDDRNYVFLQAYKQMAEIPPSMLRPIKPKGSEPFICFEIIFKGEHVMGEAGPYRQFYSDVSAELQPSLLNDTDLNDTKHLSLFIPSPNRANQLGDFKDKYVINPSNKSSYYLQLYEYLGELMGCAFRTGTFLTFDLPTMFWKKLVGQQISEEDIDEVDKGIMELVRFFKESSAEIIENDIFQTFTAMLSDKNIIELIPNGKNIKVTHENNAQFIEKFLEARLGEADVQIEAIRKGIIKIIPEVLLNCLNAKDLEKRICGRNLVDFNLLKKCTRYAGHLKEDTQLICDFWDILFGLSNADKLRFVKFCWGQERLPSTIQGFESASIRFMIKPAQYSGSQDGLLPRADTCFFNFELPNYSSKEIMKEKILLAIHTDCDSMNAEQAHSEHDHHEDQNSWVSYSEGEDGQE